MTSRERILATFRREDVDRFPVWLKMAKQTWQQPQPEPYKSMGGTNATLWLEDTDTILERVGVRG